MELAHRLGVEIKTISDVMDAQLLMDMEENKKTGYVQKEKILSTIQNMLNDKKSDYKK